MGAWSFKMIKEKLVVVESGFFDIYKIQSYLFSKDIDRHFDFPINKNVIYMTHPGGMVASYWSKMKNKFLADLISSPSMFGPKFKRGTKSGNFILLD